MESGQELVSNQNTGGSGNQKNSMNRSNQETKKREVRKEWDSTEKSREMISQASAEIRRAVARMLITGGSQK
jgi:hypothetical protein